MSPETVGPAAVADPKIFISYRRGDTSAHAGRLYDSMAAEFGDGNVFMDVDLEPGIDFVERITDAVAACHVLIVVMGPKWSTVEDEDGQVRIADPEDFVRLEIQTALRRDDVTLIPVLVSGALMPDREDLPTDIQPITRRNAIELSDGRWRYDVGRLLTRLKELLVGTTTLDEPVITEPVTPEPVTPVPPPAPVRPTPVRIVIEGILVAGLIGVISGGLANALPSGLSDTDQVLKRIAIWGPVAIGIAIWLTYRLGHRAVVRNIALAVVVGVLAAALSGVISFFPEQKSTDLALTVPAYAVLGVGLGGLMGALWIPRRVGVGVAAATAAGLLIGLVVPSGQGLPVLWVTVRSVVFVGVTLIALLIATAQDSKSPVAPG